MIKNYLISIFTISILFAEVCDLNDDGSQNIIDIIIMIENILGDQENVCDINNDGQYNIIDIVQLVDVIINGFAIEFVSIDDGVYYEAGSNESNFVECKNQFTLNQFLDLLLCKGLSINISSVKPPAC